MMSRSAVSIPDGGSGAAPLHLQRRRVCAIPPETVLGTPGGGCGCCTEARRLSKTREDRAVYGSLLALFDIGSGRSSVNAQARGGMHGDPRGCRLPGHGSAD